jgi:chromatin-remodeling ATPase INO80
MPASPLSPRIHQGYNREHPLPAFSSPARPASRDVCGNYSTQRHQLTIPQTPSRKADPMSISSIMSGNDDPAPSYPKPLQDSRRSSRASNSHPPKVDRRSSPPPPVTPVQTHTPSASSKPETLVNGHGSKAVEVNGAALSQGKARPDFLDVEAALTRIDMLEQSDVENAGFEDYRNEYKLRSQKRARELTEGEDGKRKVTLL